MGLAPFLVAAAGCIGLLLLERSRRNRRPIAILRLAAESGLTFSRRDDLGLAGYPFQLIVRGTGLFRNLVWGQWRGVPVAEADYQVLRRSPELPLVVGRGNDRLSVAVSKLTCSLPAISVLPSGTPIDFLGRLGLRGITFESD